ncbi:MAG: hypothetical protein ACK5IN_01405, partial [Microbacterium sp.]|uniref:hypothetical protein n=1 Tax=Microbacterium sp. TaxID=51671 RepID=UPI003A85F131
PKRPGYLRIEFSRKWFSHRDVVYPEGHPKGGKSISGKVKLSDYQTAMREHMIERGWPVEAEIDKANEGSYLGKKNYARADNNRIIAEDRLAAAREQEDQNLDDLDLITSSRKKDSARAADLDKREADLDRRDQETADDRLAAQNERREAEEAHRVASANQRASERARAQAEADRQYARELIAKIEWMPPEVDDWLDRRRVGDGRTMRDLFNEDTKKRRKARDEVRALVDEDAPQQTGPRTGDREIGS